MEMGEVEIDCSLCWPVLAIAAFLRISLAKFRTFCTQNLVAVNSILLCSLRTYTDWK